MKQFLFLSLLLLTGLTIFADAGISIRREHAIAVFSFSGIGNLKGYKLIQTHVGYYANEDDKRPFARLGRIINDDNYTIAIQEGGRHWDETERDIYLNLVDSLTGKTVDSCRYFANEYNIHFKIAGVKNGKLQYQADSTKAVYQYILLNQEENMSSFRRNRLIFIACSALGFMLLIGLYIRNKNKNNA